MLIERRSLLAAASLTAAMPRPAWAQSLAHGVFTHGIASGDPLADGVVLWTRFVGGDGHVAWEVAEDEAFTNVAQRGAARASFASDYCVKVDVRGLRPGRSYFYRFLSGAGPSFTGKTKTAPATGGESLTIAVFSCANLPFGYFHAYGHAALRDDIDLVLHTGDYIYEIQRGSYPSAAEAIPGRVIDPANETVSLSDYYQRYASYHTDADLLELRRVKPMCVVWDDHEIANDAWREGAGAHYTPAEGPYTDRIAAASKAYFDWMPIRAPEPRVRLYRSFDWGDLARIVLLDTRYIGRDRQIDYRTTLAPQLAQGGADAATLVAEFRRAILDDPNRTMMGPVQEQWFARTLAESKQRGQPWQLVTQQLVVGDQIAPQGLTNLLPQGVSPGSRAWFASGEQMSALGLPWNLDAWAGYPAARARFLEACAANANNAVIVGGDSHNCWVNNLAAISGGRLAAIELAGGSVASPGFERSLTNAQPGERERMMHSSNPHMAFCDLTNRGYATLKFTRATCEAEWIAFDNVRVPQAPAPIITRFASAASIGAGPGAWAL
ncbi:MAG: alkaline phosphatase D family protein [Caulobacterales bacterium]|jgi:alkaline phosphatase D|nr:alkaline phosphatase D family protein [Caulobacterales bacterium]